MEPPKAERHRPCGQVVFGVRVPKKIRGSGRVQQKGKKVGAKIGLRNPLRETLLHHRHPGAPTRKSPVRSRSIRYE